MAVFDLTGESALVPNDVGNNLFSHGITMVGSMELESNTSNIDLTGFQTTPSTFTFTLNAAGSFTLAISNGTSLHGRTGSFTENDAPATPEPSAVALLISAGLTGLCYGWRRLRRPGN